MMDAAGETSRGLSELRKSLSRLALETTQDAEQLSWLELDAELDAYEHEVDLVLQRSTNGGGNVEASSSSPRQRNIDRVVADVLTRMVHLTESEEKIARVVHGHLPSERLFGEDGLLSLLEACGAAAPSKEELTSVLEAAYRSVMCPHPHDPTRGTSSDGLASQHHTGRGGSLADGWVTARNLVKAGLSLLSSRRRSTVVGGGGSTTSRRHTLSSSGASPGTGRRQSARGSSVVSPVDPCLSTPEPTTGKLFHAPLPAPGSMFVSFPIFRACLQTIKRRQYDSVLAERSTPQHRKHPLRPHMPMSEAQQSPREGGGVVAADSSSSLKDVIEAILDSRATLPPPAEACCISDDEDDCALNGATGGRGDAAAPLLFVSEELVDRFLQNTFGMCLFSSTGGDADDEDEGLLGLAPPNQSLSFCTSASILLRNQREDEERRRAKFRMNIGPTQLLTSLAPSSSLSPSAAHAGTGVSSSFGRSFSSANVMWGLAKSAVVPPGCVPKGSALNDGSPASLPRLRLGSRGDVLSEVPSAVGGSNAPGLRSSSVSPMPTGRSSSISPAPQSARRAGSVAGATVSPLQAPSSLLRPSFECPPQRGSARNHRAMDDTRGAPLAAATLRPCNDPTMFVHELNAWSPESSTTKSHHVIGIQLHSSETTAELDHSSPRYASAMASSSGSPRMGGGSSTLGGSTTSLKQLRRDSMIRKAQYNNQLAELKASILAKKMSNCARSKGVGHTPMPQQHGEKLRNALPSQTQQQRFYATHGNANIYALCRNTLEKDESTGASAKKAMLPSACVSSAAHAPLNVAPLPTKNSETSQSLLGTSDVSIGKETRPLYQRTTTPSTRCHSAGIRGPQLAMAIRVQAIQQLEGLARRV